MRRYSSLCLAMTVCCFVGGTDATRAFGNEDSRTSVFRILTGEQSEGLSRRGPIQQVTATAPTPAPALTQPQPVAAPQMSSAAPIYSQAPAPRMQRPVNIYGGNAARQTLNQLPRRAPVQTSAKRGARKPAKPFTGIEHEPTLSPYLILDEDEEDTQNVPLYYTQVRPRLDQINTNRLQQQEIQQLRGQFQSTGAPLYEASRGPGRGAPARYMDTAQFYGGMR